MASRSPDAIAAWLDATLHRFDGPAQFLGTEPNAMRRGWDHTDVRWLLAASWDYSQAAGNMAIPALYDAVHKAGHWAMADRWYLPATQRDMDLLEKGRMPVFGIESRRAAADFDVVGTSISYPVLFMNFCKHLMMSGIPLRWADRADRAGDYPMVIVGGQAWASPEFMAPVADCVWLGEAEEEPGNPGITAVCERIREFKRMQAWTANRNACYLKLAREFNFLYFPRFTVVTYHYEDRGLPEPTKMVGGFLPLVPDLPAHFRARRVGNLDNASLMTSALKGKAESVPAYRLLSVQERGQQERARPRVFVGREGELDRLGAAYGDVLADAAPKTVTILAEAGVGKSRLTEEFLGSVGNEALVLTGRCLPYGRGITFWALGEIVRQAAGVTESDSPAAAVELIEAAASGDAEVAERIAAAIGLVERSFPLEELFFAARRFFELLARTRPVVVVWEDLHWAEATLLELIERVARDSAGRVLLMCTARPTFLEVWQRGLPGDVIDLRPLSREAIDRFVEGLLGGSSVDPAVRRRIIDASEGNPLYAEQIFAMLVDDGLLQQTDGGWGVDSSLEELSILHRDTVLDEFPYHRK